MGKYGIYVLVGACALSALLGIGLGYFIFGPMGVSARVNGAACAAQSEPPAESEPLLAYLNHDASTWAEQQAEQAHSSEPEPAHGFIVTALDGYIVVYYAAAGKETGQIMEITTTPVGALPREEQERLAQGIFIDTEEALTRILEDYGS